MLTKLWRAALHIADDIILCVGVAFLSYGVFQMYVPAGYMVLGCCFIAVAYLMATRRVLQ